MFQYCFDCYTPIDRVQVYLKGPFSSWIFCPGVRGHEGPLGEPVSGVVVVGSRRQDHGPRAHRGPEEQLKVTSPEKAVTLT